MATGTGAQQNRGMVVSDIMPSIDLPSTGDDWDRIANTFDRLNENTLKPILARRAARIGQEEGAAIARGEAEYKPVLGWGSIADARMAARETAYVATIRTDIDAREAEIRRQHALDPDGYAKARDEMVSGFIQGAPSEYAVEVETYARDRTQRGFEAVAGSRAAADIEEANQAIAVRIADVTETMIALGSREGGMQSPEFLAAREEYDNLQQMRVDNPAINYSPEQRTYDDDKQDDAVTTANIARLSVGVYGEAGKGMAGYAAGLRFLNEEILNGDAFADMDPGRRERLYRDSVKTLREYTAADREQERAEEEAERAARQEMRDRAGELRLGIMLGEVSERDIAQRPDIDDTTKASLVAAARAQQRRDRAEAEAAERAEREDQRGNYNGFRDQAEAGTLTPEEVADGVSAGLLTPGQARTLTALQDRGLKPVIGNVMAPVRDAASRPGLSARGTAVPLARAEAAAAQWARANPNASLDDQLKAGEAIARSVFGATTTGRPANAQAANQAQSAKIRALVAERNRRKQAGNPMSTAEYNRRMSEILHSAR